MNYVTRVAILAEVLPGTQINHALREAALLALTEQCDVRFQFNSAEFHIRFEELLGAASKMKARD